MGPVAQIVATLSRRVGAHYIEDVEDVQSALMTALERCGRVQQFALNIPTSISAEIDINVLSVRLKAAAK